MPMVLVAVAGLLRKLMSIVAAAVVCDAAEAELPAVRCAWGGRWCAAAPRARWPTKFVQGHVSLTALADQRQAVGNCSAECCPRTAVAASVCIG